MQAWQYGYKCLLLLYWLTAAAQVVTASNSRHVVAIHKVENHKFIYTIRTISIQKFG